MSLRTKVRALGVALVVNVVLGVLLSPLGFESRPPAALQMIGYVAIGTVFVGLVVDVAAIVLLIRQRTRFASILAIVGSVLFVFPNVVDRAGLFFTLPIPAVVNVLEFVFAAVLLATLFLASVVYRESDPSPS